MASLLARWKGGVRSDMPWDAYTQLLEQFQFNGYTYQTGLQQTLAGTDTERPSGNFVGLASGAYASNGVVFACMLVRQLVFSSIRFRWQNLRDGKPSDTFGTAELGVLEEPWTGGTTQDLLSRLIQDADLAGNSYWYRSTSLARLGTAEPGSELVRLRPDWVEIVGARRYLPNAGRERNRGNGQVGWIKRGYLYTEGGAAANADSVAFTVDEVAHFCPIPDPLSQFSGMSWLTPILREIQADHAMTRHQRKFFDNGAPQPLDARILTPTGWSTMGEMRVGDRVIGSDGKPHDVVAVYPQGEQDIYRVTFSSGAAVECTRDHLWSVASAYDRKLGVVRTMTLGEIMDRGIHYASGPAKWSVPLVAPVEFDPVGELPVDPYLLGSLLGDGCMRANAHGSGTVSLATNADDAGEQERILAAAVPPGVRIRRQVCKGKSVVLHFPRIMGSGSRTNALTAAVRGLDLFDRIGHEKSIPDVYMRGSVTDRVALLQGLLDTDGSVERRQPNEARFASTSEQLARQVAELANSLGGIGTVRRTRAATPRGRAQWTARITRLPEWIVPFRLQRKADTYRPTLRGGAYRYIQGVELVGRREAQCIGVDSDDHLYVTDDFVLTHNTPNMVIKHDTGANEEKVRRWKEQMEEKHAGVENAWKTLHLYPGADLTVVGSNLKDIDFKDVRGGGEPLALDTPVPTPTGWTTMGEIQVGDEVLGRDGLPAKVLAVMPVQYGRECYRVTFNDQTSIVADAGHLWAAMDRNAKARPEKIYTTQEIFDAHQEWKSLGNGGNRFGVPAAASAKLPDRDLLVDPYVLGVWLGDGQTAGAAIAGAAEDLPFIADQIRRAGYTVTEWVTRPGKACVIGLPGGFLAALDALGVLGDKRIPGDYLRASHEQRLELLRGLMDTDGTVGHAGHETCEFSSKYESLARQVAELARSLGQRVTVSRKSEPRSRTGETWRVTFRANPEMVPFRMPRKVARCVTPLHVKNRAITSVERVDSVPVRCIAVDTPDHLFCAGEGWILTHNTRIAAAAGVPPVIVGLSEGLAAATYCLPADQLVLVVDGALSIAAIRPGDLVWSFGDGTLRPRRVEWQGCVGEKSVFRIRTKNRTLRATGNHPVLVRVPGATADDPPSVDWRQVDELQPGDAVVQAVTWLDPGECVPDVPDAGDAGLNADRLGFFTIIDITEEGVEPVYDLTVEGDHSFIASGVVVHNSNYGQARRRLADGTAHPLWQNVAGSLNRIVPRSDRTNSRSVRLWYDATDVPFLREDEKDAAEIAQVKATTIRSYIDAGYEPESVIAAVNANDLRLLKHSGLYSVQLQKPGSNDPQTQGEPNVDGTEAPAAGA